MTSVDELFKVSHSIEKLLACDLELMVVCRSLVFRRNGNWTLFETQVCFTPSDGVL